MRQLKEGDLWREFTPHTYKGHLGANLGMDSSHFAKISESWTTQTVVQPWSRAWSKWKILIFSVFLLFLDHLDQDIEGVTFIYFDFVYGDI